MNSFDDTRKVILISKIRYAVAGPNYAKVRNELLKRNITEKHYRLQSMCLSRPLEDKRLRSAKKHDKAIFSACPLFLPHIAKQVKSYLETLK